MSLVDKLKDPKASLKMESKGLWKGPESKEKNGGITFSLLCRFIVCRERFRIHALEGLRTRDTFNAKIEYGSMWHECEETLAKGDKSNWKDSALQYARKMAEKYPFQREEIDHWLRMCLAQFPTYVEYWKEHEDVTNRTPLLQEQVFNVPYLLPSGRTVYLRGKFDAVDLIGDGKTAGIYLQENKTKSQIDPQKITRQLTYDLQTMMYIIALKEEQKKIGYGSKTSKILGQYSVKGVRYNVIRRSAHKSPESMYKKMMEDIADNRGGEWFSRWKVEISPTNIENFKKKTLNPILENLCIWYDMMIGKPVGQREHDTLIANTHWQHPYGVYNVLDQGGESDLDAYINEGSIVGLQKMTTLFPELDNV